MSSRCPTREDFLPYCDPCTQPLCGDVIRPECPPIDCSTTTAFPVDPLAQRRLTDEEWESGFAGSPEGPLADFLLKYAGYLDGMEDAWGKRWDPEIYGSETYVEGFQRYAQRPPTPGNAGDHALYQGRYDALTGKPPRGRHILVRVYRQGYAEGEEMLKAAEDGHEMRLRHYWQQEGFAGGCGPTAWWNQMQVQYAGGKGDAPRRRGSVFGRTRRRVPR